MTNFTHFPHRNQGALFDAFRIPPDPLLRDHASVGGHFDAESAAAGRSSDRGIDPDGVPDHGRGV